MNGSKHYSPRSDRPRPGRQQPGEGDDVPCEECGAVALDTGLECDECGHDNYRAVTGAAFGSDLRKEYE